MELQAVCIRIWDNKTMNRIKEVIREYKYIVLVITAACVVIFGIFLFADRPFLVNADQQLQYNTFYEEWIRLIKEFIKGNGMPLYSWNSFLGTDFWSARAFHVIGDPFVPILMLFKDIEWGLLCETIACIYCSSIFMNMYLKEYKIKKQNVRNFISIIYAISGFATLFIGQYMFHRFYAFLPLLFYGVEYFFNRKKGLWFSFAVALLFLQNYYFMFTTSIILLGYCLFSLNIKGQLQLKNVISQGIRLFGYYLVGFMVSAVVVIPAAIYLLQNARVGSSQGQNIFWDLNVYFGLISSMIVNPFPVYTDYPNIFYSGTNGHAYWYSLYVSIIPAIAAISLVFNKKRFKQYGWFILLIIVSLLIKPIASVMHGFSEATLRWSFLLLFMILVYAAIYLDTFFSKKEVVKNGLIFIGICIGALIANSLTGYIVLSDHGAHLISICLSLVWSLGILFVFVYKEKIGYILVVIELVIASSFLLIQYNKNYYRYVPSLSKEYVSYFQSIDEDLIYRMYVDPTILLPSSSLNLNHALAYGFMSTTTYDSLYEPNLSPFLLEQGIDWHIINLNNYDILNKLGVKYYIVYEPKDLPINSEFEYVYNLNHLMVYKDLNYKSIGYSYTNKEELLNSSVPLNVTEKRNNGLSGNITLEKESVLYLSIPFNKGWKAVVDGKEVEITNIDDGFLGINLDKGYHEIELYFVSPGLKLGAIITASGFLLVLIVLILERRQYGKK